MEKQRKEIKELWKQEQNKMVSSIIFLIYFIDYTITVVPFPPFIPLRPAPFSYHHPLPPLVHVSYI